jgi:protoheme IX farnesyltransferase
MGSSAQAAVSMPVAGVSSRPADFVALARPRLNLLVVGTTVAGFCVGSTRFDGVSLFYTAVGTALVAGGASAFNQVAERAVDGLMQRTRMRPLPDGRMRSPTAFRFALTLSGLGLAALAFGVNLLAAGLALAALLIYALVYTPLKKRTPLATQVGGIPGALPVLIGWAAARGTLSMEAWVLFGIVLLWQVPHFFATAWLCRDDYARAGLPMLPVVEPDGRSTAAEVLLYSAVLVPVSLVPTFLGMAGSAYFAGAVLLGLTFFALGVRFAVRRSAEAARMLFLGSIAYLPLLWGLMLANRVW